MTTPGLAEKKIADFLETLTTTGGLRLKSKILACNGQVQPNPGESAGKVSSGPAPEISVELSGPDTPLLLARNGELLHAIEHIAAKILRFEHEEHDRISFDAENFKVLRQRELEMMAEVAIDKVRTTGRPHAFPPMNSRERRLLHLALKPSGLATASTNDGPRRFVVLYPEGEEPSAQPSTTDRSQAIRNAFRRR
ncbi:hypothetical protein GCM10011507_24250 [Edaphobacter acidisoli]|uniref:R3H domain-containing protein n=1 Tax=Edaphobacter acidisoli TaxID=2040573 RepID=A0A916W6R1_9BACT|nr:R3H domain-containing nucleic acid-binding protein [Edaphobacter acidisoli]GGA71788.1 hypothetical protein GCM10011507_24250 [Edaphobacter acidisoli]